MEIMPNATDAAILRETNFVFLPREQSTESGAT